MTTTSLQIIGIYDRGLKGTRAGLAIVMKDRSGNIYQTNFVTRHIYMDQIKKSFQRLIPLKFPAPVDRDNLFTTA